MIMNCIFNRIWKGRAVLPEFVWRSRGKLRKVLVTIVVFQVSLIPRLETV